MSSTVVAPLSPEVLATARRAGRVRVMLPAVERPACVALYALDDGTWSFPAHYFFRDVPESAWRARLPADEHGRIPVGHNFALVRTPGGGRRFSDVFR